MKQINHTGRNSLPGHTGRNSLPGDLAVWDGRVAMIVGNDTMIGARYQ